MERDRDLRGLCRLLAGPPHVREAAAAALLRIGDTASDAAVVALSDKRANVRAAAATVLGNMEWHWSLQGDRRRAKTVKELLSALDDGDPSVRSAVILACARQCSGPVRDEPWLDEVLAARKMETEATEVLVSHLVRDGCKVDRQVARYLARLGSDRAVTVLLETLAKRQLSDRDALISNLDIRRPGMAEVVLAALHDGDWSVRLRAVELVPLLDGTEAVDRLRPMLMDADAPVRGTAARTIGKIGNAGAVDALVSAMATASLDLRKVIVEALGVIESPAAREALVAALDDPAESVILAAAEGLALSGDHEAHKRALWAVVAVLDRGGTTRSWWAHTLQIYVALARSPLIVAGESLVSGTELRRLLEQLGQHDAKMRLSACLRLGLCGGGARALSQKVTSPEYFFDEPPVQMAAAAALMATGIKPTMGRETCAGVSDLLSFYSKKFESGS